MISVNPIAFVFFLVCVQCCGQSSVVWQFRAESVNSKDEVTLVITANITPGWHLYSQFIEAGGPMPTRFFFEQTHDFILEGKVEENGEAVKFMDDNYEMEIIWYKGQVNFLQKVRTFQPVATLKGHIEFMTCNNEICVPGERSFSIDIKSKQF